MSEHMNKQKELVRNTVILTLGKIGTQFVSFLLLPLYTSLLTPSEYGIVDLLNTYIALLIPLFNWQFDSGLFRFMLDCRDDKNEQMKLFSTTMIANIAQSLLYIIVFFLIQPFIKTDFKIILVVDVVLSIFLSSLLQFARGLGDNVAYSFASFLSAVSTILLNILLIAAFGLGAWGLFVAGIIAKVLTILYIVFKDKAWKYFSINLVSKSVYTEIFRYSIPLVPNQLSWWVVSTSDRTILSYFIGIAANGIYSIANKFSTVYITFYNVFNLSWTESVSLHINDDEDGFLAAVINSMFMLFSSICLLIIAFLPVVFPFLVNQQYETAYQQIPILLIAVLFQVIVGLYSAIYVALKKSVEIAKTSLGAALINIVVNITLIHFIGIYAASFSTLIAYFVMMVYRYLDLKKYKNIPLKLRNIWMTSMMATIVLICYYVNNPITNIFSIIVVSFYVLITNKEMIMGGTKMIKDKFIK